MRHSRAEQAEVIELNTNPSQQTDDDRDLDEDQDDDDPPLGDPFALALGCDLLEPAPGVPGCFASMRCDCGRAFKINLLTDGRKPCPGCGIVYSHCLLVGPADDPELVTAFLDSVHGEPDNDDDRDDDDQPPGIDGVIDAPQDAEHRAPTVDAYAQHNAED